MAFEIDKLGDPQARRVWAETKDKPAATKALLEQCAKEGCTVIVITFELVKDEWEIIAWGG